MKEPMNDEFDVSKKSNKERNKEKHAWLIGKNIDASSYDIFLQEL